MKFKVFGHEATLINNLRYTREDVPDRTFPLHVWQIQKLLGLKDHFGKDGSLEPVQLGNIWVYLMTKKQAQDYKPDSTRPHRLWAICFCGDNVPAGRLNQHLKARDHCKENNKFALERQMLALKIAQTRDIGKHMEQIRVASSALRMEWTAYDVQSLRPKWSVDQCIEWLVENRKYIQEAMTSNGHEIIEGLLP